MPTDRRTFLASMLGAVALPALDVLDRTNAGKAARLAADPRRPQYHLLPAANWMNDPNGPVYWDGSYHMFYQYNPDAAVWGDMHWGHAISPDMIHWHHLPVALAPTPGGPDESGCFSGSAVIDGDRVAVVYTGVVAAPETKATLRDGAHSYKETQCLAFGTGKDLSTWTKVPQPVVAAPPAEINVTGFRDPSAWRHGDRWYMTVGSGVRGKHGCVLLYESTDLQHWRYLHMVASGEDVAGQSANPVESGDMWECPELFPLGEKHVLIYSTQGKSFWQSGVLNPETLIFQPEQRGLLDWGAYYAPKTQLDKSGNRILWGWIQETRPVEEYRAAGWAGMMSLPRILTLEDGVLNMQAASEAEALRQRPQNFSSSADEDRNQRQIASMRVKGVCGEILCVTRPGTTTFEFALADLQDDDAHPWLSVRYDPANPDQTMVDGKPLPVGTTPTGELELHLYLDGSVIELFINRKAAFTKRFYYGGSRAPSAGMRITGQTSLISTLSVWPLTPISRDRLTGVTS
ncbi:MAG TPA: glycoside hydrolase family 32 protein [Acidobacteriaceae bacterium]|nr:glycoside hydrolase family 32 protein [Acidobacteriaceae bacterium]